MKAKNVCPICGQQMLSKRDLEIHMGQLHTKTTKQQLGDSIQAQIPRTIDSQVQVQLKDQTQPNQGQVQEITNLDVNLDRHIFISGQTQSGKSVGAKFIFALLAKETCAIFYDYKHDPNHKNFVLHYPVFTELKQIEKYFDSDKKHLWGSGKKRMQVIYQPPRIESDIVETHSLKNPNWQRLNDLCNFVYKKGNMVLLIDEIAPFTSPQSLPPALYDLFIMGASRGVTVISVTQRPNVVHNTMISESYTRFLFRHELESDRIKLKGLVGLEIADQLHGLENENFIMSYVDGTWQKCHLKIPSKYKWVL